MNWMMMNTIAEEKINKPVSQFLEINLLIIF